MGRDLSFKINSAWRKAAAGHLIKQLGDGGLTGSLGVGVALIGDRSWMGVPGYWIEAGWGYLDNG